ncbi:hypothetical protein Q5530_15680 [Saccharothrix sp. BKS2]|uniref:hypothetical protein n=1 Tax=Saccharothrix sp. BKS2 TaxID=3064400 RepID=UPI0039EC8699
MRDGIVSVVRKALGDRPYLVATPRRIYRMVSQREMEPVPYWEDRAVSELIGTGEFTVSARRMDMQCKDHTGEYTRTVQVIEVSA